MVALMRSFKLSYLALLAVYFSVGLAGLTSVTSIFFVKNHVALTAAQLISLGIWTTLPWSIKMVFGAFIDGVKLFGNNRKSYIYLGQLLVILGTLGTVDHASSRVLISHLGEYVGLLVTGILGSIGVVISDIVVDTMAIETTQNEQELGMIQVWSRVAQSGGAILGAALTGILAKNYLPAEVFALALVCPALAIVGTALTPLRHVVETAPLDKPMVLGGLAFGGVSIASGMLSQDYGTLIMLVLSALILAFLFRRLTLTKPFIYAMLGLFLFRASPGIGPGLNWFYTDKLAFDELFLGQLSLVANVVSIVALVLLAKVVSTGNVFKSLAMIAFLTIILSIPDILVFYDVWNTQAHARQLILVDSSLIAPITSLSMVPLGIIVAKSAPAQQRAVYISLTASLMNLALVAGDVGTQLLNKVYPVTRADQSQLGVLMTVSLVIGAVLSIGAVALLYKTQKGGERV